MRRMIFTYTFPKALRRKTGLVQGIGMCTALVSSLTNVPVKCRCGHDRRDHVKRGEVSGYWWLEREAAGGPQREGSSRVIIPQENVRDLKEIPDNIKNDLEISACHMDRRGLEK